MIWVLRLLLLAALIGFVETYPILDRVRHFDDDTVVTPPMVEAALGCLASLLVWAIYLAAVFVPWIAQRFVDLLFSVRGSAWQSPAAEEQAEKKIRKPGGDHESGRI